MPYNMEGSFNKKSEDRIPRRPGYLEKSRHITFRDDNFITTSPLERRISEIKQETKRTEKTLDQLQKDYDKIRSFPNLVKQKEDLLLMDKLSSLMKASAILDKSCNQALIGDHRSSSQQTEMSESIDIESIEDGLSKSKEILKVLKTREVSTQEIEKHLTSVESHLYSMKEIIRIDNKNKMDIPCCQENIERCKKSIAEYRENAEDYKEILDFAKEDIKVHIKFIRGSNEDNHIFKEINDIKKDLPNVSFNTRAIEDNKIDLISNEKEFNENFNKVAEHLENIASYNKELEKISERVSQNNQRWKQNYESFSHQMKDNFLYQMFSSNDQRQKIKLLKEIDKSPQEIEKYAQKTKEYVQTKVKYFRALREILQERASILQEAADLSSNSLKSTKSIMQLNKVLVAYKLEEASSDFKALLSKVELDKRNRHKKFAQIGEEINSILKEVGLGSSKRLPQAKRIAKAGESLKSKHSELDEAIQKIRQKKEDLQKEFNQLTKEDLQKESDQLEKNVYRYNPRWMDSHHEAQRDMIHLLSEGGSKYVKIDWKKISKSLKQVTDKEKS